MGRALAVQPQGGSMHLIDRSVGFLGAVPIVEARLRLESGLPSALYWERHRSLP